MIHIISGNDTKNKKASLKKLIGNHESFFVSGSNISKEILYERAGTISLFGESPVVVIEGLLSESDIVLSVDDLKILKDSPTIFIFLEDALLAKEETKFKKYADIQTFDQKITKSIPKINVFAIADAFGRKDKVSAWILYRESIQGGAEPEAISGMLFWKIKTMLLSGAKTFDVDTLKHQSGELVSLYHKAHRGELDFTIGLEQFILSSLTK